MTDFPFGGIVPRYPPPAARQSDLIEFLESTIEKFRGRVVYGLLIAGTQGVGKSRIASMLAYNLGKQYKVYYDISVDELLNADETYDYVILDDISAAVHAYEYATRTARYLAKLVVLIRNIARYGFIIAAPRERDILKPLRSAASHRLYLYAGVEARRDCDLYAVYLDRVRREVREFCSQWEDLYKRYGDGWRELYNTVQQKRIEYLNAIKQTLVKREDKPAPPELEVCTRCGGVVSWVERRRVGDSVYLYAVHELREGGKRKIKKCYLGTA